MERLPIFPLGTVEDLDITVENFGVPVADPFEVQVRPFGDRELAETGWRVGPYRIDGLPRGRYGAWTRWRTPTGAAVIDYAGEWSMPSFEVR